MFRTLEKKHVPETQGSGGASQPTESPADASQLGGMATARLNLGCFNVGLEQDMIPKDHHQSNLIRIIGKGVGDQDLHLLNLCEVGAHKEGLEHSNVRPEDLVSQALTRHYKARSCQAYMATWQAEDEPEDENSVTLKLMGDPEVVELGSAVEPQLVISVFSIDAAQHIEKHGLLISGQLHIRSRNKRKTTAATKNGSRRQRWRSWSRER